MLTHAFGLLVESSLAIPGAAPLMGSIGSGGPASTTPIEAQLAHTQPADLTIQHGPDDLDCPVAWPVHGKDLGPYRLTGDALWIDLPGVARFRCSLDGRTLTCQPSPEATTEDLESMLVATALPTVLWVRGSVMLHAAACVLPGHCSALALCGPSGAGKSTLLRSLLDAGASALAEDSLALQHAPPGSGLSHILAAGLPGCTLHRPIQGGSLQQDPQAPRIRKGVPPDRQLRRAPLGIIIVLAGPALESRAAPSPEGLPDQLPAAATRQSQSGPSPLRRLHGPEALAACLNQLHRPKVPRLLGRAGSLLPFLAALLRQVPIHALPRQGNEDQALSALLTLTLPPEQPFPPDQPIPAIR